MMERIWTLERTRKLSLMSWKKAISKGYRHHFCFDVTKGATILKKKKLLKRLFMADILFEEHFFVSIGIFIMLLWGFLETINGVVCIACYTYCMKAEAMLIFLRQAFFFVLVIVGPWNIKTNDSGGIDFVSRWYRDYQWKFLMHFDIPRWKQTSKKTVRIYPFRIFLSSWMVL